MLENVTIAKKIIDRAEQNDKKKTFAEQHPILIGLFCSFVMGLLFLFSFWDNFIVFVEGLF